MRRCLHVYINADGYGCVHAFALALTLALVYVYVYCTPAYAFFGIVLGLHIVFWKI